MLAYINPIENYTIYIVDHLQPIISPISTGNHLIQEYQTPPQSLLTELITPLIYETGTSFIFLIRFTRYISLKKPTIILFYS